MMALRLLSTNASRKAVLNKQNQKIIIAKKIFRPVVAYSNDNITRPKASRRFFYSTPGMFESYTMNVPSMGDSITEGTMVEWLKDVGEYATEDEVIAIVETDKVSVDIRAPVNGTITEIMAALDTNVEVGQALVRFDTEGQMPVRGITAAADTSSTEAEKEEELVVNKAAEIRPITTPVVSSSSTSSSTGRTPLIRFRHGKRDVIDKMLGLTSTNNIGTSANFDYAKDDLYFILDNPNFTVKTKSISEEEMELINLGGADDGWDISQAKIVVTKI